MPASRWGLCECLTEIASCNSKVIREQQQLVYLYNLFSFRKIWQSRLNRMTAYLLMCRKLHVTTIFHKEMRCCVAQFLYVAFLQIIERYLHVVRFQFFICTPQKSVHHQIPFSFRIPAFLFGSIALIVETVRNWICFHDFVQLFGCWTLLLGLHIKYIYIYIYALETQGRKHFPSIFAPPHRL